VAKSVKLTCVLRSSHLEGHVAAQLLEGVGLFAQLRGGDRSGLGGMIPMEDARAEVWVREQDRRDAQQALGLPVDAVEDGRVSIAELGPYQGALSEAGETEGELPSDPENCPACGSPWESGFAVCWNCQHHLDPA
jgi:hypothetical protein